MDMQPESRLRPTMLDEDELFPETFADPSLTPEIKTSDIEKMISSLAAQAHEFEIAKAEKLNEEIDLELSPQLDITNFVENVEHQLEEEKPQVHIDEELQKEIENIPDRMAFKIGDVAEIVDIKQYVLRYWETEFDVLKPKKSRQNQRMYSKKDIENILMIKKLLYRDKFSIEGARRAMKELKNQVREVKQWDAVADRYEFAIEQIRSLKAEIQKVTGLVSRFGQSTDRN